MPGSGRRAVRCWPASRSSARSALVFFCFTSSPRPPPTRSSTGRAPLQLVSGLGGPLGAAEFAKAARAGKKGGTGLGPAFPHKPRPPGHPGQSETRRAPRSACHTPDRCAPGPGGETGAILLVSPLGSSRLLSLLCRRLSSRIGAPAALRPSRSSPPSGAVLRTHRGSACCQGMARVYTKAFRNDEASMSSISRVYAGKGSSSGGAEERRKRTGHPPIPRRRSAADGSAPVSAPLPLPLQT